MNNVQFVARSSNSKTGPIPTTTSARATCPPACPLAGDGGCYAEAGYYTRLNWDKVDAGERGTSWREFLQAIASLKPGQLWRHNVAGDLQGANNRIDGKALRQLTQANQGKRGFTYTHYPLTPTNIKLIEMANREGFTINASTNTIGDAVRLRTLRPDLPVVTIMPEGMPTTIKQGGQTIVTCPATYRDNVNCSTCKLCAVADRQTIVGFPVHGTRKRAAAIIATSED